jgi:hypothetical protein
MNAKRIKEEIRHSLEAELEHVRTYTMELSDALERLSELAIIPGGMNLHRMVLSRAEKVTELIGPILEWDLDQLKRIRESEVAARE